MKKMIACMLILCLTLIQMGSLITVSAADMEYYGVNDAPQRYETEDALNNCKRLVAAGVKWVRLSPEWNTFEPEKGVYNQESLEKMDTIVNYLHENGVNILWVLGYSADWAVAENVAGDYRTKYAPQNIEDWQGFVDTVTKRYKDKVSYWEVWNEANKGNFFFPKYEDSATREQSLTEYMKLLKVAYETVKANNAGEVLLAGMTPEEYGEDSWFKKISIDKEGYQYYDIISVHYAKYQHMDSLMKTIEKYPAEFKNKPVWITEAGTTSLGTAAGELKKANYVQEVYDLYHRYPKVERVFWYMFRNVKGAGTREDNYGLVGNTLSSQPAMYAFNGVAGASTDFVLQKQFPNVYNTLQSLYYLDPALPNMNVGADDGKAVEVAGDAGQWRKIPHGKKMYFRINDRFLNNIILKNLDAVVDIEVEYVNDGEGQFHLEYDGKKDSFTPTETVTLNENGKAVFHITDGLFNNRQGNKEDFCIVADQGDITVKKVTVYKQKNHAKYVMGTTTATDTNEKSDSYKLMTADLNEFAASTVDGRGCRAIPQGKAAGFRVAKGVIMPTDHQVKIGLIYSDDTAGTIQITYGAADGSTKTAEITAQGDGGWRYGEVLLSDAGFNETIPVQVTSGEETASVNCDFTVQSSMESLQLHSVEVTTGEDLKPAAVPTASEVTVEKVHGEADAGDDLRVSYKFSGDGADATTLQWQRASAVDGNYTDLPGATAREYTLKNQWAGQYIRVAVTPQDANGVIGKTVYSEPVQQGKAILGTTSRPNYQAANYTNKVIEQTPKQYRFKVAGCEDEFVLLEEFDSDSSKYFVTTCSDYGERIFDSTSNRYYDAEIATNVAHFLNHEFVSSDYDGEKKLPQGIIEHIDFQHSWKTDFAEKVSKEPYRRTYGIGLLSRDEFYCYCDKTQEGKVRLGVIDNLNGGVKSTAKQWGLRSRYSDSGLLAFVISESAATNMINTYGAKTAAMLRPAFYLDKDFFKTVKLDLSALSSDDDAAVNEVVQILQKQDIKELLKIYTAEELRTIGMESATRILSAKADTDEMGVRIAAELSIADGDSPVVFAAAYQGEQMTACQRLELNGTAAAGTLSAAEKDEIYVFVWKDMGSMQPLNVKVRAERE